MKTIKGIYYDLNESTYTSVHSDFKFYFSSLFYKEKFDQGIQSFINQETLKLKIKYGHKVSCDDLFYLSYYKQIEKRGYKVECNKTILNPNSLMLMCKIVRF